VLPRDDENNWLSLRNEPTVHLLAADQLNTYDVLLADQVVFTVTALNEFLGEPQDVTATDTVEDTTVEDTTVDDTDAGDDTDEEA
jgi:large subunit ribosomal protein L4